MAISLFYHYYAEPDAAGLADFICSQCESLGLRGRIRVAAEGVNGTVGGDDKCVHTFEDALSLRIGSAVDFKHSAGDARAFPGLQVRVVEELVTLGAGLGPTAWTAAAPTIEPEEFLAEARAGQAVLLDARNGYESAIGHFRGAVLPKTRQFAELPRFLRENADTFRGRRVLLYCTGGVRCETASAFLAGLNLTESMAQLRGGIHRFLEAFPDGAGEFCGKNLVFDKRGAIKAAGSPVVGRCFVCETSWDSYGQECRCAHCRARVLICSQRTCMDKFGDAKGFWKGRCEICRDEGNTRRVPRRGRRKREMVM